MTVLIVDDSKLSRNIMASIMGELKCEDIYFASTGAEAISQYKAKSPTVVTMDITMPDMNGVSTLSSILKIDANAKVIMATSHGAGGMLTKALSAGASGYIVKPLEKEAVKNAIYNALDSFSQ